MNKTNYVFVHIVNSKRNNIIFRMFSVLINAYACSPGMGSEPGMAWNWCVNLARYCELYIITEGEFKDKIEAAVASLPQRANMHFYYNPVSEEIRKMCWNQGDWRFYKYYREWQWSTYLMAKDIIRKHKIDIVHQLNMIGFREPGYLWRIENVPFVWGPVDAKEKFPTEYLKDAGLKARFFFMIKNIITMLQLKYSKRVRQAAKRASVIVSASSNTQETFRKYFDLDSPLINETGCYVKKNKCRDEKNNSDVFNILWVGKMDFRKQLGLALKTIAVAENSNIRLHIVGGGNSDRYKEMAHFLGISDLCIWHGEVGYDEVQTLMLNSDLFFFTSVAEGTPHVVLEAIGNSLPVICFNTCGQGDSVDSSIGRKIELSNPDKSATEFADIISVLYNDRSILKEMSENCIKRQEELSWENKASQMVELYKRIIHGSEKGKKYSN